MENLFVLAKLFNDGALTEAYSAMPDAPVIVVVADAEKRLRWKGIVGLTRRVGRLRRASEADAATVPCPAP